MNIGIDMDDVLCNFQKKEVEIMHGMYGRPPLDTMPVDWEGSNLQVSAEEYKAFWTEAAKTYNLWLALEPLPAFNYTAMKLLQYLDTKHDLFFVTNRFKTPGLSPSKQTKAWLRIEADLNSPTVVLAKEKGPMASVLELDAFIDDRPKNVLDVLAARPCCKVYLCDSSHNKAFNDPRIPRVASFNAFAKLILEE
jgi:5'(3')-deoxyribonucleotidase